MQKARKQGGRMVYAARSAWEENKRFRIWVQNMDCSDVSSTTVINKAGGGAPRPHPVDTWLDSPLPTSKKALGRKGFSCPSGWVGTCLCSASEP